MPRSNSFRRWNGEQKNREIRANKLMKTGIALYAQKLADASAGIGFGARITRRPKGLIPDKALQKIAKFRQTNY